MATTFEVGADASEAPAEAAVLDTDTPSVYELVGFRSAEDYLRSYEGFTALRVPSQAAEHTGYLVHGSKQRRDALADLVRTGVQKLRSEDAVRALLSAE